MQKKKMLIHVLFHIIPWEFLKTIFFLGKGGANYIYSIIPHP